MESPDKNRPDTQMLVNGLMGSHDHFVLQTRGANLLLLMWHINGEYGQRYYRFKGPFLLGP